ncbi:MAG: four helix bundle protein [Thermoanaerobaculia bacterium]
MSSDYAPLRQRLKAFALDIIDMSGLLPENNKGWVLGKQVLRSGTSIGANYTEAQRASSRNHFISILETSLREADETKWWLELIHDSQLLRNQRLLETQSECEELIRILVASINTAKRNRASQV